VKLDLSLGRFNLSFSRGSDISFDRPRTGSVATPSSPISKPDPASLESRVVPTEPSEFYIFQPELSPLQVRGLLYSAMQGNFYAAYDLFSLMQDSAPRLLINLHQLREDSSSAKIRVHPFCLDGKKPSSKAVERRDYIDWALQQFAPDTSSDEVGLDGLFYEILGDLVQPTMCEIMYHQRDGYWVPRAASWINPRKYAFDPITKKLGITSLCSAAVPGGDSYSSNLTVLDPVKCITSTYKTRSGSMTLSGLIRPLAWWWSAMMYGRRILLQYAQRHSTPFIHSTYAQGTPPEMVAQLAQMANNWQARGHAETLDTMAIKFIETHFSQSDNPSVALIKEFFDYYCDIVLLRETRASDIGRSSIKGGSAQAGQMKQSQTAATGAIAGHGASVLTNQLVRNLCILNYGDADEAPHLSPDFAEPTPAKEKADTVLVLSNAGWERDPDEMNEDFNMKLTKAAPDVAAAVPGGAGENTKGETPFDPTKDIVTLRREYWRQQEELNKKAAASTEPGQSVQAEGNWITTADGRHIQIGAGQAAAYAVHSQMSEGAKARFKENIGKVVHHDTLKSISEERLKQATERAYAHLPPGTRPIDPPEYKTVSGYVYYDDNGKAELHADGTGAYGLENRPGLFNTVEARAAVYAHESGHVIDGPDHELSSSSEWKAAHRAEGKKLSHYATTAPSESFAEFSSFAHAGPPRAELEARAPKMTAFWKERGLL
jgi:phage gp29-like protein